MKILYWLAVIAFGYMGLVCLANMVFLAVSLVMGQDDKKHRNTMIATIIISGAVCFLIGKFIL